MRALDQSGAFSVSHPDSTLDLLAGVIACPDGSAPAKPGANDATVHDAWVRLTPPGAPVTAGYMPVRNTGDVEDCLLSASTPGSARLEIHDMDMSADDADAATAGWTGPASELSRHAGALWLASHAHHARQGPGIGDGSPDDFDLRACRGQDSRLPGPNHDWRGAHCPRTWP